MPDAAPGQLGLSGNETEDPRQERVARALWHRDAMRGAWPKEDNEGHYRLLWPRVKGSYMQEARVALDAADKT